MLVDLLANALAEILMQRLGYTLAEVQAKLLMDKVTDRIARQVETFYNTVGEEEGELMASKAGQQILRTINRDGGQEKRRHSS